MTITLPPLALQTALKLTTSSVLVSSEEKLAILRKQTACNFCHQGSLNPTEQK